jgi:4-amino-4-deoxy-L-arabinose transferase-like glycosyltransferase
MEIPIESLVISSQWKYWLEKWFYLLAAFGILVNATGLLLPILEPDGALYATISKNMVLSGDYISLRVQGNDWLDKPHFPFWLTAFSFKLFGLNSFAYKFPALLFWLAGGYFTYAFSKMVFNRQVARLSFLIYLSVEHLIISNNDVRAEPYLTGLIIAAAYYYYRTYKENKWIFIIPGSLFLAMATMTKGIFIPAIVFGGFFIEWIVKKKWNEFLKLRWWIAVLLLMLFISPELICLYIQFDSHPEKIVFGTTHVSGIRFFFWDSQFGRFFNTGPIKGNGDPFFYMHTILWAFLPWSPLLIVLLADRFKKNKEIIIKSSLDFVCSGIFLSGFILFSLSRFQLPHYLNFLYPFLSIVVANYLIEIIPGVHRKIILYSQNILYVLLFLCCLIISIVFGLPHLLLVIFLILATAVTLVLFFPGQNLENTFGRSFAVVMIVNVFLNCLIYPELFRYQSGIPAATFVNENNYDGPIYTLSEISAEYAFEFYSKPQVLQMKMSDLGSIKEKVNVFTSGIAIDSLRANGFQVEVIKSFPHFHISRLTGTFINHNTRYQVVDSLSLVKIYPRKNI